MFGYRAVVSSILLILSLTTFRTMADTTPDKAAGLQALNRYAASLAGERRQAAEFLLAHLPEQDAAALRVDLFRENLEQAFVARESYPWTMTLPQAVFFNDVLPHAVIDETRDPWRKRLREMFHPHLAKCETLQEAYAVVGGEIKELSGVKYSTKREKACQSAAESIRAGMASCTGLSILMVSSLRASGLPARLVAIPLWGTREGNHTWVEVFDGSKWRFSAYGRTPARWDKGWEIARCAYCDPTMPIHGVFASSYRKTNIGFPTVWTWRRTGRDRYYTEQRNAGGELTNLVWTRQKRLLSGIDRTAHYIEMAGGRKVPIPEGKACVAVRAFAQDTEQRVKLPVRIYRGEVQVFDGYTAAESQDLNDYVRVICEPGDLRVELMPEDVDVIVRKVTAEADKESAVRFDIPKPDAATRNDGVDASD